MKYLWVGSVSPAGEEVRVLLVRKNRSFPDKLKATHVEAIRKVHFLPSKTTQTWRISLRFKQRQKCLFVNIHNIALGLPNTAHDATCDRRADCVGALIYLDWSLNTTSAWLYLWWRQSNQNIIKVLIWLNVWCNAQYSKRPFQSDKYFSFLLWRFHKLTSLPLSLV